MVESGLQSKFITMSESSTSCESDFLRQGSGQSMESSQTDIAEMQMRDCKSDFANECDEINSAGLHCHVVSKSSTSSLLRRRPQMQTDALCLPATLAIPEQGTSLLTQFYTTEGVGEPLFIPGRGYA